MRWYLLSSSILRGGDLVVTEPGIREVVRQIVLPLMDATKPVRWVSAANSLMLQRASGRWVRAGSSHARALTVTTTSGGKSPGAPRA